jgi:hypothetical protein
VTTEREIAVDLEAVIVAVTDEVPRVLTVPGPAIPSGRLDPDADRTLDLGLRRWVREQTGRDLGYVEQLYTFGDRDRVVSPRGRLLSVAYLALVVEESVAAEAEWRGWYELLPWEDHREGKPDVIEHTIVPALDVWVAEAVDVGERSVRRRRAKVTFGLGDVPWDGARALERYELLYEAGLIEEKFRDENSAPPSTIPNSVPMVFDHRRVVATAIGRLRGKLTYRPVVFELLPDEFTLRHLQRVVEAMAGTRLHTQNFRRLVERAGLVEGTGNQDTETGGRPAELFRFRREVMGERPRPGVGFPGGWH